MHCTKSRTHRVESIELALIVKENIKNEKSSRIWPVSILGIGEGCPEISGSLCVGAFLFWVAICWWQSRVAGLQRPKSPRPRTKTQYSTTPTFREIGIPILSIITWVAVVGERRGLEWLRPSDPWGQNLIRRIGGRVWIWNCSRIGCCCWRSFVFTIAFCVGGKGRRNYNRDY